MDLKQLIEMISPTRTKNLLVGIETADDAGVYSLSADTAQIHTADVITPITSDPYLYGQVAAANSLSDIYAMGGRPLTAVNLCFFPDRDICVETLGAILQGGLSKIEEAGAVLVGGHTVRDMELKYGLSVTGLVHPKQLIRNAGARPGDKLILTKPIGMGVHITAGKQGIITHRELELVVQMMAILNKAACEVAVEFQIHGGTDITGFGLAGHILQMARASNVGIRIYMDAVPCFPSTLDLIAQGIQTSLTEPNKQYVQDFIKFGDNIENNQKEIFYDPQTSGGLLLAVRPIDAGEILKMLYERGVQYARIIGECLETNSPHIQIIQ